MKFDVLIEYDKKSSEVTFSSEATQFTQTRPARIGLSHPKFEKYETEFIEFVGEDWESIKNISDWFKTEPSRKDQILRIVNPFEPTTFEPFALFRTIDFFSTYIFADFYPKTWNWRKLFPIFNKCEIKLKIPDYKLFNSQKKAEFEKLIQTKYKRISFDT